ncbi:hypothetical protein Anapl_16881 [Anas platyrhynchos]|uniref:Uncharacterized protein n=1 Tax=Anas platyrhynchos TaxID=8839 RepID=R0JNC9_ANAPL|nr:hypothetical protein Anapl_16881 [Anas platyrhynchos]
MTTALASASYCFNSSKGMEAVYSNTSRVIPCIVTLQHAPARPLIWLSSQNLPITPSHKHNLLNKHNFMQHPRTHKREGKHQEKTEAKDSISPVQRQLSANVGPLFFNADSGASQEGNKG